MAKLPKDQNQPEEFRFKVPGVEVTGTGQKASQHAAKLAYAAIGVTLVGQIVGLVVGRAFGWW